MEGIHGTDPHVQMSDPQNSIHLPYEHHHHQQEIHGMSNGSLMNDDEEHENCHGNNGNESDIMVEPDVDQGNLSDTPIMMVADHTIENGDQLTLSFQGQVYVFDSVSPEKGLMTVNPQPLNMPQRLASLLRFREKRKERNFDKKIRYTVRKEVALRYIFCTHSTYHDILLC
ncbi:GATA transcription factor 28 [Linum perenne]